MPHRMPHPGMEPVDPQFSGLAIVCGGTHCASCRFFRNGVCMATTDEAGTRHPPVDPDGCCAHWEPATPNAEAVRRKKAAAAP